MSTPTAGAEVRSIGVVHVYRVFGTDVAALRGADLTVSPGERIALLGPSGSGKSTLLTILAGLRRPSAGSVLIDGDDIARYSGRRLHRYRAGTVGLMLQGAGANLLSYASAADNVRFAVRTSDHERIGARGTGGGGHVGAGVLQRAGLLADPRPVSDLDRAARQAVALAVALASRPRLLLVDEPTSQLADAERDGLLDALVMTTAEVGTTVVMVTHDEAVAARMQRMIRMRDGRIGAEGQRHEQYAVIGSDGSVQLPEELLDRWPPGATVQVDAMSDDELRISRRPPGPPS